MVVWDPRGVRRRSATAGLSSTAFFMELRSHLIVRPRHAITPGNVRLGSPRSRLAALFGGLDTMVNVIQGGKAQSFREASALRSARRPARGRDPGQWLRRHAARPVATLLRGRVARLATGASGRVGCAQDQWPGWNL